MSLVKKIYQHQDFGGVSKLVNAGFELLAADPTGLDLVEGRHWVNTTTNVEKIYLNGTIVALATEAYVLSEINKLDRHQGAFDAGPGALPTVSNKTAGDTATLIAGDQWVITNGGTVTGIQGDDVLATGDKIEFLGGTAADANSWVGIQRNIDESALGGANLDRQTVSLVANTPLIVASSSVADIHSIQVYSDGALVDVCVEKTANSNQRQLTSNQSITVDVEMVG